MTGDEMRDREVAVKVELDSEHNGSNDDDKGQERKAGAKEDDDEGRIPLRCRWRRAWDFD